jgi:hypothetical protein
MPEAVEPEKIDPDLFTRCMMYVQSEDSRKGEHVAFEDNAVLVIRFLNENGFTGLSAAPVGFSIMQRAAALAELVSTSSLRGRSLIEVNSGMSMVRDDVFKAAAKAKMIVSTEGELVFDTNDFERRLSKK